MQGSLLYGFLFAESAQSIKTSYCSVVVKAYYRKRPKRQQLSGIYSLLTFSASFHGLNQLPITNQTVRINNKAIVSCLYLNSLEETSLP